MVHLRNKAKELAQILRRGNLNRFGFPIIIDIEGPEEGVPDEQTPEQVELWHKNYVIFTVEFQWPLERYSPKRYLSFDCGQAYKDFDDLLQQEFGPDVHMTFRQGCMEYEVQRIGDSEYGMTDYQRN